MHCRSAAQAGRITRREKRRHVSIMPRFNQAKKTLLLPLGAKRGHRKVSDGKT